MTVIGMKLEDIDINGLTPEAPVPQKPTPEYLQELLKDKKQLQSLPNAFKHVESILEREIGRVREKLFHINGSSKKSDDLPEAVGPAVTIQEKVFVPIKDNPTYNFVGRLLGPRGLTAKQLEQDLGCKIMVRGEGSMRDKKKEEQNRGKPNWEHLNEELHVLITVEDSQNRSEVKMKRAVDAIKAFLDQGLKTPENEDKLKQMQLMELAIINEKEKQQQLQAQQVALLQPTLTTGFLPTSGASLSSLQHHPLLRMHSGATSPNQALLLAQAQAQVQAAQRFQQQQQQNSAASLPTSNLLSPTGASVAGTDPTAFLYQPIVSAQQYLYQLPEASGLFADYSNAFDASSLTNSLKMRTNATPAIRTHPYQR